MGFKLKSFPLIASRVFSTNYLANLSDSSYPKHIQTLKNAGFKEGQATSLVEILGKIADARAREINQMYLTKDEYGSILKAYNSGIDRFFMENQSVQKNSDESIQESYSNLIQRTSSLNSSVTEEIKTLESGIQLDINLEKKKQAESLSKMSDQAADVEAYLKSRIENVRLKLTGLEQNGKYAIFAFMGSLTGAFAFYSFISYLFN